MKGIKRYQEIILLSLCVIFGGLHNLFVGTGYRADIFLFYDYPNGGRFISNILHDLGNLFTITTALYLFYKHARYKYLRNIAAPFLIISAIDIVDYVLFFKQLSLIKLPILLILIVYFYKKK
jgi:hypothetical protein